MSDFFTYKDFEEYASQYTLEAQDCARIANAKLKKRMELLKELLSNIVDVGKAGDGTTAECNMVALAEEALEELEGRVCEFCKFPIQVRIEKYENRADTPITLDCEVNYCTNDKEECGHSWISAEEEERLDKLVDKIREEEFWEKVNNNLAPDPVRQYSDGWYFWEETWADKQGPFKTEQEARDALDKYCKEFLGQ